MKYIILFFLLFANVLFSQDQRKDTLPTFSIDAVVITADRIQNTIANTTSSVTVFNKQELQRIPAQKLSDVLQGVPGFFVTDRNGTGRDPIVASRGFYGGGEAEYCLVLVDGQPVNDIETGLVNWNLVPMSAISSIEVVRGASSPLYGDAALGGIVNIITQSDGSARTNALVSGGSYDTYSFGVHRKGNLLNLPYQAYMANERTHGFRDHSSWQGTTFGGDVHFSTGASSSLKLTSLSQWTVSDDPGPLSENEASVSATQSNPFYKGDGKNERRNQITLNFNNKFSDVSDIGVQVFYHNKVSQHIRTFANTAVEMDPATFSVTRVTDTLFGDTKQRDIASNELGISSRYSAVFSSGQIGHRFHAGIDGSYNTARSMYYYVFGGREEDYRELSHPSRTANALTGGTAGRNVYAVYLFDELKVAEPLTFTVGARFDYLDNRYDGEIPETTLTSNSSAFSPKAGLNYRYMSNENYSGSVFASVNRSFKAPTLDQLSDQRPVDAGVFVDFGGGPMFMMFPAAPFSNSDLKPQRGTSYEIGAYNKFTLANELFAELSLSAYLLEMEDEIDFDLFTYRYQNILESRHRGIEAGMKLYAFQDITASVNYSHNDVTFVGGMYDGNSLKGIPQDVWNIGVGYAHESGFTASLALTSLHKTYLDDMNTLELPDFTTVNAKISYRISQLTFNVDSYNLFDRAYSSTGYLLNGKTYLYPASGRTIRGGVEVDF